MHPSNDTHDTHASPDKRLRSRRHALGLTAAELALRSGVSLSYLRVLEAGYRPTGGDAVTRVEQALVAAEQAAMQPPSGGEAGIGPRW